jgi:hypothetical protein
VSWNISMLISRSFNGEKAQKRWSGLLVRSTRYSSLFRHMGKSGTFDCFGDNSGVYVCLLDGFVTLSSRGGGYSCLRLDLVVFSLRRNRYRKSGWLQTGVRVFNYSMRGGHEYGE